MDRAPLPVSESRPSEKRNRSAGVSARHRRHPRTEPASGKSDTGKTWTEFAPDAALRKPDRTVGPRSR
jgi:hypothetical protein